MGTRLLTIILDIAYFILVDSYVTQCDAGLASSPGSCQYSLNVQIKFTGLITAADRMRNVEMIDVAYFSTRQERICV